MVSSSKVPQVSLVMAHNVSVVGGSVLAPLGCCCCCLQLQPKHTHTHIHTHTDQQQEYSLLSHALSRAWQHAVLHSHSNQSTHTDQQQEYSSLSHALSRAWQHAVSHSHISPQLSAVRKRAKLDSAADTDLGMRERRVCRPLWLWSEPAGEGHSVQGPLLSTSLLVRLQAGGDVEQSDSD